MADVSADPDPTSTSSPLMEQLHQQIAVIDLVLAVGRQVVDHTEEDPK